MITLLGLFVVVIGFTLRANPLLVVVAVTWVMRKLRGSKSTERLPR